MLVAPFLWSPALATGDTGLSPTTDPADACTLEEYGDLYVDGVYLTEQEACSLGEVEPISLETFLEELRGSYHGHFTVYECDANVTVVAHYVFTEVLDSHAFVDEQLVAYRSDCFLCTPYCCGGTVADGSDPYVEGSWPAQSDCVAVEEVPAGGPSSGEDPNVGSSCGCGQQNGPAHLAWVALFSLAGWRRSARRFRG